MRVLVNVLAHTVLPCMHHALAALVLLATTCCEKLGQLQGQAAVVYRGHCVRKTYAGVCLDLYTHRLVTNCVACAEKRLPDRAIVSISHRHHLVGYRRCPGQLRCVTSQQQVQPLSLLT
jgi:hypothetical protein